MRIWIIDSDWLVTRTLQEFLTELGHEVESLPGEQRLADLLEKESEPVDLVIMDLCTEDALEKTRLRRIHERFPSLRVIAVPKHNSVLPTEEALAHGIHAFLHRPVQLAELELMLVRLAENHGRNSRDGQPGNGRNTVSKDSARL
ncbi:MAG: hypothetical protein A3K19_26150 [Lentisphaerae bacterium RIFOXYB12_FULL_65_16]|nr:MAG: hypothetical protein A3K18_00470 [Lentisphaerae bacterium RIFOXYA12_64_32]OGV87751.1 MAG: hypothetical protein A3K19_26150 [Lentisphaerae bacterium RIFOXYB12_FULL_65_16]